MHLPDLHLTNLSLFPIENKTRIVCWLAPRILDKYSVLVMLESIGILIISCASMSGSKLLSSGILAYTVLCLVARFRQIGQVIQICNTSIISSGRDNISRPYHLFNSRLFNFICCILTRQVSLLQCYREHEKSYSHIVHIGIQNNACTEWRPFTATTPQFNDCKGWSRIWLSHLLYESWPDTKADQKEPLFIGWVTANYQSISSSSSCKAWQWFFLQQLALLISKLRLKIKLLSVCQNKKQEDQLDVRQSLQMCSIHRHYKYYSCKT